MCGLFGWNFKKKSRVEIGKRECVASVLAIANSLRGDKSWGVYTFSKQGPSVRKQVGDISMVPDFSLYGRYPLVMGHTRQPTQGDVTKKNAHPFTVNKITLAHNGVVHNSDELDTKHGRKVRVDSQHFAFHLAEGKSFEDIAGYGAITWVHADEPEKIYICRLKGGSLNVYGVKNGNGEEVGTVWSSDFDHLRNAIGAARLNCYPYKLLSEGMVYFVRDGGFFEAKDMGPLKLKEPTYRTYTASEYWDREERGFWRRTGKGEWVWVQRNTFGGNYDDLIKQEGTPHSIERRGKVVMITEKPASGTIMRITRWSEADEEDLEHLSPEERRELFNRLGR